MNGIERVLVLAPHPDDGEFGAGATLKRLSDAGARIYYVAFSPCLKSLPAGSADDLLFKEMQKATAQLGIAKEDVRILDYPVREFPAHRQEILEHLIRFRAEFDPQLVLLPNSHDIHQDHQVIHQEGIRAFKHRSILGYELPWNNLTSTSNYHVAVDEAHLEAKMAALKCYSSQEFRDYLSKDFILGLAKVRGLQVGEQYAESFEAVRWVW